LDAAEHLFIRARDIDPTDASVHQHYGLLASVVSLLTVHKFYLHLVAEQNGFVVTVCRYTVMHYF